MTPNELRAAILGVKRWNSVDELNLPRKNITVPNE